MQKCGTIEHSHGEGDPDGDRLAGVRKPSLWQGISILSLVADEWWILSLLTICSPTWNVTIKATYNPN